jgi:N-acetylneuraminic acid mutarotase
VVINGTLYLTGGVNTASRDLNDMWATNDGNAWVQLTANAPWSKREQQAVIEFQGRIILAGGITGNLQSATDVWRFTPGLK